jgi:hypothetical protein
MRLVSATVVNFRSITRAHKIPISNATVLIGPNNEGKSNIVGALVIGMRVIQRHARFVFVSRRVRLTPRIVGRRTTDYDWERDYPIQLQAKQPQGQSEILLEFELDAADLEVFKKQIGSKLNGTLPLKVSLGPRNFSIEVVKQGRGSKTLNEKSGKIARFVADRIELEHIPAIRTAKSAQDVVEALVTRELSILEENPRYREAQKRLSSIQRPLLRKLSKSITATLNQFVPSINNVEVKLPAESRAIAYGRACEIWVDDGQPTLLQQKGTV